MGTSHDDDIQTAWRAAHEALDEEGLLQDGWSLSPRASVGEDGLELRLELAGDERGIGLQWRNDGDEVRAFQKGGRFATSYRRGPGLWDVDDGDTPEEIRRRAHRACRRLAHLTDGPDLDGLQAPPLTVTAPPGDLSMDELARAFGELILAELGGPRLPGTDGWVIQEVGVFQRWSPVAEVRLQGPDRTLCFIAHVREEDRAAFASGARFDLTYYSDDLTPEEHGQLYGRDRELIDAMGALFSAWERG